MIDAKGVLKHKFVFQDTFILGKKIDRFPLLRIHGHGGF